jgi:hypothetical protein
VAKASFLILAWKNSWQAARVNGGGVTLGPLIPLEKDGNAPAATSRLVQTMRELGYAGGEACLGLDSSMVLTAPIDGQNVPRKGRRKALLYRLEACLPIEAERLTADYLPAVGGQALAVAVETAKIQPIIDQLSQAGAEIASIVPTSLLVLGESMRGGKSPCDYAIVACEAAMDLFRLADGVPVAWHSVASVEHLRRAMQVELLRRPIENGQILLRVFGQKVDGIDSLSRTTPALRIECDSVDSAAEIAARGAARALSGNSTEWCDLRRDGLAMPDAWKRLTLPLAVAACASVFFMTAFVGSCLWRASRYSASVAQCQGIQETAYRRLYPNTPVPVGVASRFRSESRRLAGLSGQSADLPRQVSALDTLRGLIGNLPPAVRLRIADIRLSPGGIVIEGQARSHGDAETIVQSLAKGGLSFEPPRSDTISKGDKTYVSFTLSGKPASPAPASRPAGAKP